MVCASCHVDIRKGASLRIVLSSDCGVHARCAQRVDGAQGQRRHRRCAGHGGRSGGLARAVAHCSRGGAPACPALLAVSLVMHVVEPVWVPAYHPCTMLPSPRVVQAYSAHVWGAPARPPVCPSQCRSAILSVCMSLCQLCAACPEVRTTCPMHTWSVSRSCKRAALLNLTLLTQWRGHRKEQHSRMMHGRRRVCT